MNTHKENISLMFDLLRELLQFVKENDAIAQEIASR